MFDPIAETQEASGADLQISYEGLQTLQKNRKIILDRIERIADAGNVKATTIATLL